MIDRINIPSTPPIAPSKPVVHNGDRKHRDRPPGKRQEQKKPAGNPPDKPLIDEYI